MRIFSRTTYSINTQDLIMYLNGWQIPRAFLFPSWHPTCYSRILSSNDIARPHVTVISQRVDSMQEQVQGHTPPHASSLYLNEPTLTPSRSSNLQSQPGGWRLARRWNRRGISDFSLIRQRRRCILQPPHSQIYSVLRLLSSYSLPPSLSAARSRPHSAPRDGCPYLQRPPATPVWAHSSPEGSRPHPPALHAHSGSGLRERGEQEPGPVWGGRPLVVPRQV